MKRNLARLAILASIATLASVSTAAAAPGLTDSQARGWIAGKIKLDRIAGDNSSDWLPAKERPYASRMYGSGPFRKPALNLFYAVGAVSSHFAPGKRRAQYESAVALVGRDGLADDFAESVKHPATVARYGVTVREFADATARGVVAGLLG